MSKFDVKVGKGKKPGLKAPAERKSIHPGLQRLAVSIRCLGCGTFLEWVNFSEAMLISTCDCGIWFKDSRQFVRWVRWSSTPFQVQPDGEELYAPKR